MSADLLDGRVTHDRSPIGAMRPHDSFLFLVPRSLTICDATMGSR
jgi:hypothetical protein